MQASKRSLAIILSLCLLLTAVSTCFLGMGMSAAADGVPQASFTYDFTDPAQFGIGAVTEQAPAIKKGSVTVTTDNANVSATPTIGDLAITADPSNVLGLGAGAQALKLGNTYTGGAASYADFAIMYHPMNSVTVNDDGSKTFNHYPVTKLALDAFLPDNDTSRGGFFMSKGTKPFTYDAENNLFTTTMSYMVFALQANATDGLQFHNQHGAYKQLQYKLNANNQVEDIVIADFIRPTNGTRKYTGTSTTTLGSFAVDADGNALSAELVAVLNNYFTGKTALTAAERWVHIETSDNPGAVDNKQKVQAYITFNFTDYADLRAENSELPEQLRIRLTGVNETQYSYNEGSDRGEYGLFGFLSGYTAKKTAAVKNVTADFDVSAYYAVAVEEFKTAFAADFVTVVGGNGYFDQKDLTAVTALLESYNNLDAGIKALLANDADVAAKVAVLESAKAALEGGAYYFDAFEHGLNYEVTSKVLTDVEKNGINIKDVLNETNVYSDGAASNAGENGAAFWGIHTDVTNVNNQALWLRKSFNENNMNPTNTGNPHTWPSVLYTPKAGILPEGAAIQKVTGKMFLNNFGYGNAGYKAGVGIVYDYTDEYHWKAAVLSNAKINKAERQSESTVHYDQNGAFLNPTTGEAINYLNVLKLDQWIDFVMEYNDETRFYELTICGENTSGASVSYTVNVTPPNGAGYDPLTKLGFVHGAPTKQSFDDIAVTLKGYEPVDFAPDTLGAKILKQPTENGDQNLRIDFDFSNTIANGAEKNIVEYGAILQAGTQEKATLMDAENTVRTVIPMAVNAVSEIPETFIVTITNSAENSGKRVSAIAYVKDAEGNYYYSENDNAVISDGMAVKSVMGVMKAWYSDVSVTDAEGITAAATAYKAADAEQTFTVEEILAKVAAYAGGDITTGSPEYALCKELLSKVFHYYYNAAQA